MFTELGDTPLVIAMTRLWHGLLPSSVPHDDVDHHKACVLRGNYLNKNNIDNGTNSSGQRCHTGMAGMYFRTTLKVLFTRNAIHVP